MAIATLERCYDNPVVFSGIVKIRRGEAVKLMMSANSLSSVKTIMRDCITRVIVIFITLFILYCDKSKAIHS